MVTFPVSLSFCGKEIIHINSIMEVAKKVIFFHWPGHKEEKRTFFEAREKKIFPQNVATKLEGGGRGLRP